METDSTEEDDLTISFGLVRPTLLRNLKLILDEYPDNAQILKELIQNAEDAGATTVKFMYDENTYSDANLHFPEMAIFNKCPSLLVYNDKTFTVDDWNNLGKIANSSKKVDPLKVGKFGLGFKSVFHLTDCPTILSGTYFGMLDPYEKYFSDNIVVRTGFCCKLSSQKFKLMSGHVSPMLNKFGYSVECNEYPGTLFRFPLRMKGTELSETVYTDNKMKSLIDGLIKNYWMKLLFLTHVRLLDVYILKKGTTSPQRFHTAKCSESPLQLPSEISAEQMSMQGNFVLALRQLLRSNAKNEYVCASNLTITSHEAGDLGENSRSFIVCHYFNNSIVLDGFSLMEGYMPRVSCAIDISLMDDTIYQANGHIFVFLPLPQEEGMSLTGLPIHINGYFAVSQNRRHLKWPTDEQIQKKDNEDCEVEWNNLILRNLLPDCYIYALLAYRVMDIKADVSSFLPNDADVDVKFKLMLSPFYVKLVEQNLFRVHHGQLAPLSKANIIIREANSDETISSILKVYSNCSKSVVVTTDFVVKAIGNHTKNVCISLISPDTLIDLMKHRESCYGDCLWPEKVTILQYVLQCDENAALDGLKLLPLNNGEFTSFRTKCCTEDTIYVCDNNARDIKHILPTLDEFLLHEKVPDVVRQSLLRRNQIKSLTPEDVVRLLTRMLNHTSGTILKNRFPYLNKNWNKLVWSFVKENLHGNVFSIKNIPLLCISETDTVLNLGCLESDEVYIVSEHDGDRLPLDIVTLLRLLGIHVIDDLTVEVKQCLNVIGSFIFPPTVSGVVNSISKLFTKNNFEFIQDIDAAILTSFADFLASGDLKTLNEENKHPLRQIPMFKQIQGERLISLSESKDVICRYGLPVLPQFDGIIDARASPYKDILQISCDGSLTDGDALVKYLLPDIKSGKLGREDIEVLMKHVLQRIDIYQLDNGPKFTQMISELPFIFTDNGPKCASELFDFEDLTLMRVFDGTKFPCPKTWENFPRHLKDLGLKTSNHVTLDDILDCVTRISDEILVFEKSNEKNLGLYVNNILKLLNNFQKSNINPSFKNSHRGNFGFMQWLPISNTRPSKYPSSLKWKSEEFEACPYVEPRQALNASYALIAGAVHSIVNIDSDVASLIGVLDKPDLTTIVCQLRYVATSYTKNEKMEYMAIIDEIYCELQTHSTGELKDELVRQKVLNWIWCGDGFTSIDAIFKQIPFDMQPYVYSLPSEMSKYSGWLMEIGMSDSCSYPQVLNKIKSAHDFKTRTSEADRDRGLVIRILKQCSVEGIKIDVLLPVIGHEDELRLLPADDCTINERSQYLMFGDVDTEINYIHPDLSPSIATEFGAHSLMSRLVGSDDPALFEFDSWGQHEPLTQRIKNIIKDYTDGFALPKEMIQNADDARATEVMFIWDERENESYRDKLLHPEMKHCQGPALWVYNNAYFSDSDLKNITNLGAGTKEEDVVKIGKFGLGFNAVYNMTDVPSFLSDTNFVIFDPHSRYLDSVIRDKSKPGILINLEKKHRLLKLVPDQFQPYQEILGCDLTVGKFDKGTLFRLPLRTHQQAEQSEISQEVYDQHRMKMFLQRLKEGINELLLFTQNVVEVKVYHIGASTEPSNAELLYKSEKNLVKDILPLPILRFAEDNRVQNGKEQLLNVTGVNYVADIQLEKGESLESAYIGRMTTAYSNNEVSTEQWLIATYCNKKTKDMARIVKALPLAMVALKLDNDFNLVPILSGNVFCHLPLPVLSGLPVHINGHFAVASNRRHLAEKTSDEISNIDASWNETLISKSLPYAYSSALENLKVEGSNFRDILHLFPRKNQISEIMDEFLSAFYRNLVEQSLKFFHNDQGWHSFDEVEFLSQPLMECSVVNDVSLVLNDILSKRNISIAIIPNEVLEEIANTSPSIKKKLENKTWTVEKFYNLFLSNLGQMPADIENIRDRLLCFALELSIKNTELAVLISKVSCIPVQKHSRLLKPDELVDPDGDCASLYDIADGKFPTERFLERGPRHALCLLKMSVNELTTDNIVERASSIAKLADSDVAYSRAIKLLSFLDDMLQSSTSINDLLQGRLLSLEFLPVKCCPPDWCHIAWRGNCDTTRMFVSPNKVYSDRYQDLIGSMDIVCEVKGRRVEDFLKLKKYPSIYSVLEQLRLYCTCAVIDVPLKLKIKSIYSHLEKRLKNEVTREEAKMVESFFESNKVFLIDDTLMSARHIARTFVENTSCIPFLTQLHSDFKYYPSLLENIELKTEFDCGDFVGAISRIMSSEREVDINVSLKIIMHLADKMKSCNLSADYVKDKYGSIYVLDRNKQWQLAKSLCYLFPPWYIPFEDQSFAHEKIDFSVCELMGVKSARENLLDSLATDIYGGSSFGQREDLTTRISALIEGYPADETILKEILQNADDAGATKIEIILDKNSYDCCTVLGDKYKCLQGPALLVHNDRPFRQVDIEGIQKLGQGAKETDSAAIGQFGVGFNCVYSLTDTPQILTESGELGKKLCILDPNCSYIQSASKLNPGRMYDVTDKFSSRFTDVLEPFEICGLPIKNCTMIRLPLRTDEMAKSSKISSKLISIDFVIDLLEKFQKVVKSSLLFLKNVKSVKISVFDYNGMTLRYKVSAKMSANHKKQHDNFIDEVKRSAIELKKTKNVALMNENYKTNFYQLTFEESDGSSETWCVSQVLGLSSLSSIVDKNTSKNLKFLPIGGVAYKQCSLPEDDGDNKKQIFCFLPIPETTNLPVHINGHFALDNTRRGLWNEVFGGGFRKEWNNMLFRDVIANAYVSLIEFFQKSLTDRSAAIEQLLPKDLCHHSDYVKLLVESVYGILKIRNIPILEARKNRWFTINDCSSGYAFFDDLPPTCDKITLGGLIKADFPVLITSMSVCKILAELNISVSKVEPIHVLAHFKNWRYVSNDNALLTMEEVLSILKYCKNIGEQFYSLLGGTCLCFTQDEVLRPFEDSSHVFKSSFHKLFPSCKDEFLHENFLEFFDDAPRKLKAIRNFCINDCALLLEFHAPDTLCKGTYAPYNADLYVWLKIFWRFIVSQLRHTLNTFAGLDHDLQSEISKHISPIATFPILPVSVLDGSKTVKMLTSMEVSQHVFSSACKHSDVERFLRQVGMPYIDESFFLERDVNRIIHVTCSVPNPKNVLASLSFNLNKYYVVENLQNITAQIKPDQIKPDKIQNVLEYLARAFGEKFFISKKHSATVRALPIHQSINLSYGTLNDGFYIVPRDVPCEGLLTFEIGKFVLENENNNVVKMYERVGCKTLSTIEFYENDILPVFHKFTTEQRIIHLKYLRNKYFSTFHVSEEAKTLSRFLKTTPSITNREGLLCSPGDLCDPTVDVLRILKSEADFPEDEFSCKEWLVFLRKIGLKLTISAMELIKFAKEIECEAHKILLNSDVNNLFHHNLCPTFGKKCINCKAKAVVQNLFSISDLSKADYERIQKIPFIPTDHMVMSELSTLCPQKSGPLVPFCRSVVSSRRNICWSSVGVLPEWATSPTLTLNYSNLNVIDKPDETTVISHCITLCNYLSDNDKALIRKQKSNDLIKIMLDIYTYLNEKSCDVAGLQSSPCVFIDRNGGCFVHPRQVVINMDESKEIIPHLFRKPKYCGAMEDFLVKLGACSCITVQTYVNVLNDIKLVTANQTLHDNDLQGAINATREMCRELSKSELITQKLTVSLLTWDYTLLDSSEIYYIDRPSLQRRVTCVLKQPILLEQYNNSADASNAFSCSLSDEPSAKRQCCTLFDETARKRLVEVTYLRPLSDLVSEHLTVEAKSTAVPAKTVEVLEIQAKLRDPIINEVIYKIIDSLYQQENEKFEKSLTEFEDICRGLQVWECSILSTQLSIYGNIISDSKSDVSFFTDKIDVNCVNIYFCSGNIRHQVNFILDALVNTLISSLHHLQDKVRKVVDYILHSPDILNSGITPKIRRDLTDEYGVVFHESDPLTAPNALPLPGNFVPVNRHHLLSNSFAQFYDGEYVGYLVADSIFDNDDDTSDAVFIYGRIISKCDAVLRDEDMLSESEVGNSVMNTCYNVNIGSEENIKAPAYDLYKILRVDTTGQNLVEYDEFILPDIDKKAKLANIIRLACSLEHNERCKIINRLLACYVENDDLIDYILQILAGFMQIDCNVYKRTVWRLKKRSIERQLFRQKYTKILAKNRRSLRTDTRGGWDTHRGYLPVFHRTDGSPHRNPQPGESRRWFKQATFSLQSAPNDVHGDFYSMRVLKCHLAGEQGLTAMLLMRNADRYEPRNSRHNLTYLVGNIDNCPADVSQLAMELQSLVGNRNHLLYPNTLMAPGIPHTAYNERDSEKAQQIAESLLAKVQTYLSENDK